MKIVTWNLNAIRPRMARLLAWLERHRPDVLCIQEVRLPTSEFPALELLGKGYHAAVHSQKGRNGVAILSREAPADVACGLGDDVEARGEDRSARLIAASVSGLRVLCAYAPNGGVVGSPEWMDKLRWFVRLRDYLDERCDPRTPLVLAGDLNIAPEARDVADPRLGERENYFHPKAREAFGDLVSWGLVDLFRVHRPEPGEYSWWDYRMSAFKKNIGLRLDHVLGTRPVAERLRAAYVDREERAGEAPSDHAPVVVEIEWP